MLSNPDVSAFFYHPWYNIQAIKYNRQIELLKLGPFWPNPPILSTSAPAYAFPAGARYG